MDFTPYVGSIVALFQSIGSIIAVPVLILSFFLGFHFNVFSSSLMKFFVLLFSIILYIFWQSMFVFEYKQSPADSSYFIAGWTLTQPAQMYVDQHPFLNQVTRSLRNAELAKSFGAKIDVIWLGTGLTISRIIGLVAMGFVCFCLGVVSPHLGKSSAQ
jgi:hypothetical protein